MKCLSLLAAAALLLLAPLPTRAAEAIATVTVEAGVHDRLDTPICVTLPEAAKAWGPVYLTDATTDRAAAIPAQADAGHPPRLAFILPTKVPTRTSRTFHVWQAHKAHPRHVAATEAEGRLDVSLRGKPVLRYHKAQTKPPEGVEARFAHEAYIHPAHTPAGHVVTDDYPPDHKHQRGIWFSWTKTEFQGRHPDFWNLGKQTAYTRFARMGPTASGPVFARFSPIHEHFDLKTPGGPRVILTEDWTVRVWNVGGPANAYYMWDLTSRQRCAGDAVHLPKYHYGGLGYRGHRDWLNEVTMTTSEGKTRKDGNESTARWLDVSGPLDGARAGCLILIHPSNFRYPQPLRLNPNQPQICVAPSQGGPWDIVPGDEYVSRYRFVIHDGPVDNATAERLWADFAEPPTVKVALTKAAAEVGPANGHPLKVCMISGAAEYKAKESCAAFKALLEKQGRVVCTHLSSTDKATSLPGLEALKDADVLFVFLRRNTLPEDQLRIIQDWCKRGRSVVGVRTASHAFQNWLAFDKAVLGGNYNGHYGHGPVASVHLVDEARGHPVLAGVRPFQSAYSLYKNTGLAGDVTVLATATAKGQTEPVAWTRVQNGGRVFYTSLGGPTDFQNPDFQRMLTNAVFWAAKRVPGRR